MRTVEEINAEIAKVEKAKVTAVRKVARCLERLDELTKEKEGK